MEIHIQVRLGTDGFPTTDELELRWALEDSLEEQAVGEIDGSGGGLGVMDIYVLVSDPDPALAAIHSLLREYSIEDVTTVRVVAPAPE